MEIYVLKVEGVEQCIVNGMEQYICIGMIEWIEIIGDVNVVEDIFFVIYQLVNIKVEVDLEVCYYLGVLFELLVFF